MSGHIGLIVQGLILADKPTGIQLSMVFVFVPSRVANQLIQG